MRRFNYSLVAYHMCIARWRLPKSSRNVAY